MTLPDRDVLLCRDCCCGSRRKHPRTDHAGQRDAIEAGAAASSDRVRVRVVDCLDECDRSNVVVVRDFTAGRRPVDTWLGEVHSAEATERVAGWVRDGGDLPDELDGLRIRRRRKGRV